MARRSAPAASPARRQRSRWRAHLRQARTPAVASGDPALGVLYEELAAYPSAGERSPAPDLTASEVAVPLRLRVVDGDGDGDGELAFISTITTFGTAVDVTVSELSIEAFFPADEATAGKLRAMAAG